MPRYLRLSRRESRQDDKPRAKTLAELPRVLAAAPAQHALFEPTQTGEASLAAIAEILDAPSERHMPFSGVDTLLIRAQPSKAQATRLSAALIRACAAFDRCRVVSRDARTKQVCESWSARCFSALRCAEKMLEDGERKIARYDAVDTLLTALFAADSVLQLLMDGADCGSLGDAAADGHIAVIKALSAEAAPVVDRAEVAA
ncbi:hypothetical protein [Paraburkholderia sp. BCC1876]|uniref:hypothetical protein n=1 Tax=Paraburkholderia sp. BCC1876 TaxID=2676303 RepID=UPI00158FCD3A|nr:hypothetical protein [Paraburkholderia sp. BCC1876]